MRAKCQMEKSKAYNPLKYTNEEMVSHAESFYSKMNKRRSVRKFSSESFPNEVIDLCLKAAGTAPSGANKQPWHFVVIQTPKIKKQIRKACEKIEYEFYHGAAGDNWLNDLKNLKTNSSKPFLEEAPCLIAIFAEKYGLDSEGNKSKNYYVNESVGIAIGILITALQHAGLSTLTYTPIRMEFLSNILNRPENERPIMILVLGKAAENVEVPDLSKKKLNDYVSYF